MIVELESRIVRACTESGCSQRQIQAVLDALERVPRPFAWLVEQRILSESQARVVSTAMTSASGGMRIGRYRILRKIGEGGTARIFEAWDETLERTVAVKLPRPGFLEAEMVRFRREARVLAMLRHPGIVAIHDAGEFEGRPYLVMELVDGESMLERIERGTCGLEDAVRFVEEAAEGVHCAHEHCVLHRDLKPANVLVTRQGNAVVTDFGLAKLSDKWRGWTSAGGDILGTPAYMSPEQIERDRGDITVRTDVWGLGATLYHALTGQAPFEGCGFAEVLHRVLHAPPVPPRVLVPSLPADLEEICLHALEKDPGKRPASAADLARRLREWREGRFQPRGTWRRFCRWFSGTAADGGRLRTRALSADMRPS